MARLFRLMLRRPLRVEDFLFAMEGRALLQSRQNLFDRNLRAHALFSPSFSLSRLR
jgi:hypothetical protein